MWQRVLCSLGWHVWGKWQIADLIERRTGGPWWPAESRKVIGQARTCAACGLSQLNSLTG